MADSPPDVPENVAESSSTSPNRAVNWSSLKDFLAVADSGSLSAAARGLSVSQPTLSRRIAALEDSLHVELFRRSPQGLELTEAGEALIEPARQMERGAQAAELVVTGRDLALAGLVRITSTDGLAVEWLIPTLAQLRVQHPGINFEIVIRLNTVDLLRREADIAIRLGRPRQAELTARRVGELAIGLYASQAYIDQRGKPESEKDLHEHLAVGFDEGDLYAGTGGVVGGMFGAARVVFRANTLTGQLAAIRAGFGIGGQACFIANRHPNLVRMLPQVEQRMGIWLVTHPGLRRSARIRATYDFLAEQLTASKGLFAGE
jgi:DNA-binding transcriptional LysR family regulator